ncbi:MAG: hypothetical protein JWN40_4569 [Phycisphaerales bacterium]|nr:hypothetical protein [Phycisphaerales bacterium]
MIYIVAMPFGALIIAIIVIGMIRGLRQARELRGRTSDFRFDADKRRPSDDYHDQVWLPLCTSVAQAAAARLNRPLSDKERRKIWRTRTALTLEVVLKEINVTPEPGAVAALIATLPPGMDRPDPTGWCAAQP